MTTDARTALDALEEATAARREALFQALRRLDRLLEAACDAAEATYGSTASSDPYRGFYVSPQDFRHLLGRAPGAPILHGHPDDADAAPFAEIRRAFGLSAFDADVLVVALAPEIDLRYQRLFAYLQDDVTRKRPTVDLALNLLCPTADAKLQGRRRFALEAPLVRYRLLQTAAGAAGSVPFLARDLEIDDAVVAALVGDPALDRRLQPFSVVDEPGRGTPDDASVDALARLARSGRAGDGRPVLFHFRGPRQAGQRQAALALAGALGRRLLTADCRPTAGVEVDFASAGGLLVRDARLHDAILCLDGLDALRTLEQQPKLGALLSSLRHALDVAIVVSETPWALLGDAPGASGLDVVSLDFSLPSFAARRDGWRAELGQIGGDAIAELAESLAGRFRLTGTQIRAAAASARNRARLRAAARPGDEHAGGMEGPTADDLFAAARSQSAHRLGTLARQIHPRFRVSDLILPDDALAQLQEVCNQVRQRHIVYDRWGFDRKLSLGKGINVLFSGPPGVGKTMAAEVFANELALDLFKIDLSQIVSKYIGETEKNLNAVFDEARASNAILFFDEADALFGKRSEVRDSHDRYANIEIAYLLQKMDEYEGLSVLATNLKQNLDEAFTRRLSFIIDFPFPDEESRLRIWRSIWPDDVPVGEDVDLAYLARAFRLSGGSIKNVAVAAAFLAAEHGEPIRTGHLVRAARREFQKMGKTMSSADPGRYAAPSPALAS